MFCRPDRLFGPFATELEACEAYAALENRETDLDAFAAALHPEARLIAKWHRAYAKNSVIALLAEWGGWHVRTPQPLSCVTVLASRTRKDGTEAPLCCSIPLHDPTQVWTETSLTIEDGFVTQIFVYSVWLDPHFPFPERVTAAVERLQSKGIALVSPPTKRPWSEAAQALVWD